MQFNISKYIRQGTKSISPHPKVIERDRGAFEYESTKEKINDFWRVQMRNKLVVMLAMLIVMLILIYYDNEVYAASCYYCGGSFSSTGSSMHACQDCGHAEYHSWGSWSKHTRSCTVCGYSTSHTPSWSYSKYSDTHHTSTCTICSYSSQTTHSFGGTTTTAATCTTAGSTRKTCGLCNQTVTTTIPATGHSWGGWSTTVAPTCTTTGTQKRTCNSCGTSETSTLSALGHTTPNTWNETDASKHYKNCTVCGTQLDSGVHVDNDANGYCDDCNYLLDITPPEASVSAVNNKNSVTITGTATDDKGIIAYAWTNSETTPTSWTTIDKTTTLTQTLEVTSAGNHYFWVKDAGSLTHNGMVTIYEIRYDANNGAGAPASQYKAAGSSIVLEGENPTRSGYSFKGWNTESNGSGTNYSMGTSYSADNNLVLYAKWGLNTFSATLIPTSFTYEGVENKPTVEVKDGDTLLTEGEDYTVTYQGDTINVGTVVVLVKGINDYSEVQVAPVYSIQEKNINSLNISMPNKAIYNGSEKTPNVTILHGAKTLVKDIDFTVTYSNNTAAGEATATINGINNYTGTKVMTFEIVEGGASSDDVWLDLTAPTISNISVNEDKEIVATIEDPKLSTGEDGSGVDVDTIRYIISKDSSEPSAEDSRWSESNALTDDAYGDVYIWIKAEDVAGNVAIEGTTANIEFNVEISKHPESKSGYAGETIEFTVEIETEAMSAITYQWQVSTDGGNTWNDIDDATEQNYVIDSITANMDGNKYRVVVGNKVDTNEIISDAASLTVVLRNLNSTNILIELDPTEFEYDGEPKEPTVTVTDNGETLEPGTDYDVVFSNNIEVGIATATITGKNDYKGSVEKYFRIVNTEGDSDKVYVDLTPPNITDIQTSITNQTVTVQATIEDPITVDGGTTSGVNEAATRYAITESSDETPADSAWQESNVVTTTLKGSVYLWIKAEDNVGNVKMVSELIEVEKSLKSKDIKASLLEADVTYNGEKQSVGVVVTDGEETLDINDDYSVEFSDNINVGTATVTITGKGDYSEVITLTFEIKPKAVVVKAKDQTIIYGETSSKELKDAELFDAVANHTLNSVTYTIAKNGISVTEPANAGTYEIKVSGALIKNGEEDVTSNYDITYEDGTLTIGKTENTLVVTGNTLTYNGRPQDLIASEENVQGDIYYAIGTELTSDNCSTAGSKTKPTGTNAGDYTVYYYTPGNTNYGEKAGSVTARINKANPTLSAEDVTVQVGQEGEIKFTYTGDSEDITATAETAGIITIGAVDIENRTIKVTGLSSNTGVATTKVTINIGAGANYNAVNTELTVTVNDSEIVVTTNPSDVAVKHETENAIFNVEATGTNLTYQWYKVSGEDEDIISGATSNTLTIIASNIVKELNGTQYYCKVSNNSDSVDSSKATLTVYYEPTITANPEDQTVDAKQTATFTATVENGNPTDTTYLWQYRRKSTDAWISIPEATEASYTTEQVTYSMNGFEYRVLVGNSQYENTVASEAATLTVNKIKLAVPVIDGDYTYDGTLQTVKLSGFYNDLMSLSNETRTNAGTQDVKVSLLDTINYSWDDGATTVKTVSWTIAKKDVTVTALDQAITYGENISQEVNNARLEEAVTDHTLYSVTFELYKDGVKVEEPAVAGNYDIIPKDAVIKNGETNVTTNYNITYVNGIASIGSSGLLKPSVVGTYEYNGENITVALDDKFNTDLMKIEDNTQIDAGSHTVTVILKDKANYTWADGTTTDLELPWTINRKPVTVKANNQEGLKFGESISKTNNDAILTGGVTGHKLNSVTFVLTLNDTEVTEPASVGNYKVKVTSATIVDASSNDVTSNYDITYEAGDVTITANVLTKPSIEETYTYNGEMQTVIPKDFDKNLMFISDNTGTDAKTYIAKVAITNPNYVWEDLTTGEIEIPWTIAKKEVTVTAANQTIKYGEEIDKSVSKATLTGAVEGHTLKAENGIVLTATTTTAGNGLIIPDDAVIVSGDTEVTGNYEIKYESGTLVIEQTEREIIMQETLAIGVNESDTIEFSYSGEDTVASVESDKTNIAVATRVDGENGGTITITGAKEGTANITVTVPATLNYKTATKTLVVTVYAAPTAPTITVTNANGDVANDTWSNKDLSIEISGSTLEGSGEVGYKYSFNGSEWSEYNNAVTYDIETEEMIVYAKAYNKTHNTMESEVTTFKIKLDKTAPENATMTNTATPNTITMKVENATDNLSGIKEYEFYLNGELKATQKSGTYAFTALSVSTQYVVGYVIRDNAGNATTLVTATVSTSEMTGDIVLTPSTYEWTNQNVSVEIIWPTGVDYGVIHRQVKIGDGDWMEYDETTCTVSKNTTVYARTVQGETTLKSAEIVIDNIDKISPSGSVVINDDDKYTNSSNVILTIIGSDNASGVSTMSVNNSPEVSVFNDFETAKSWILEAGEGERTVYVILKDAAGNMSSISWKNEQ